MQQGKNPKECNPWKRNGHKTAPDDLTNKYCLALERPKFSAKERRNLYLDINTKRAALSVSPFVVSLVSYTGEEELYQSSGTIIDSYDAHTGIILTTANLIRPYTINPCAENIVADKLKVVVHLSDGRSMEGLLFGYDFYYNFAAISFKSDSPIQVAKCRHVDDCPIIESKEASWALRHHSNSVRLAPGDDVIAVGRYFISPYEVMAAPGEYCLDRSEYDCKELFMTTCRMTRCGDGSPLLNNFGEVIGIAFFDVYCTPFMPMNVAYKWWEHYKIYGEYRRPSLQMRVIAFQLSPLEIMEKAIKSVPSISKGATIKKVISGSSAESAGLRKHDVIVQCGGRVVRSFLEFFEIMWDNVGNLVDLIVVRAGCDTPFPLKLMVESASDQLNSWPRCNYW